MNEKPAWVKKAEAGLNWSQPNYPVEQDAGAIAINQQRQQAASELAVREAAQSPDSKHGISGSVLVRFKSGDTGLVARRNLAGAIECGATVIEPATPKMEPTTNGIPSGPRVHFLE